LSQFRQCAAAAQPTRSGAVLPSTAHGSHLFRPDSRSFPPPAHASRWHVAMTFGGRPRGLRKWPGQDCCQGGTRQKTGRAWSRTRLRTCAGEHRTTEIELTVANWLHGQAIGILLGFLIVPAIHRTYRPQLNMLRQTAARVTGVTAETSAPA